MQKASPQTSHCPVTPVNAHATQAPKFQAVAGDTQQEGICPSEAAYNKTPQDLSSDHADTIEGARHQCQRDTLAGHEAAAKTPLRTLASHRAEPRMGSTSSLAGSSQTHQHMDATSSDAAMSDDDWSHRDQRGSFASLDSVLTDHSMQSAQQDQERQQEQGQQQGLEQSMFIDHSMQSPQHQQEFEPRRLTDHSMHLSQHQQQQEAQRSNQGCIKQPCHVTAARADSGAVPAVTQHLTQHQPQHQPPAFRLARSKQQYLQDVAACQQALYDGESYEICLTTALVRQHPVNALHLYRTLRKVNPAPYAAWMSFGADELQICCSSPERFVSFTAVLYNCYLPACVFCNFYLPAFPCIYFCLQFSAIAICLFSLHLLLPVVLCNCTVPSGLCTAVHEL